MRLPKNPDLAKIYADLLKKDVITFENFERMSKQDSLSATGAYRKVVAKPDDVVFDVIEMQNENEDILMADYMK